MSNGWRTFLIVWLGQLVSAVGSGLTSFGIGVWVFKTTGSAESFGLTMVCYALPNIVFSPLAGALVDRWDRRIAMLVSDAGAGLSALMLAMLALNGSLTMWQLYVLVALSSTFATLSWPAFSAVTSLLVPKEHLGRANGLMQGAEAASMILTPVLGGAVMAWKGLGGLVVADAVSFALAIVALLLVRVPRPPAGEPTHEEPSIWREAAYGFRYIFSRPGLLGMLGVFFAINFAAGMSNVLWAPLMLTYFDEAVYGRLMGIMGLGMLAGTVLMGAWGGPKKRINGVLGGTVAAGIVFMIMLGPPTQWVFALTGFLTLLLVPIMNGCSQAIWQVKVEPAVQGRVFAVRRMIAWMTAPASFLISGRLADRVFEPALKPGGALADTFGALVGTGAGSGMRLMFGSMGVVIVAIGVVAALWPHVRNVERDLPDALPSEPVPA